MCILGLRMLFERGVFAVRRRERWMAAKCLPLSHSSVLTLCRTGQSEPRNNPRTQTRLAICWPTLHASNASTLRRDPSAGRCALPLLGRPFSRERRGPFYLSLWFPLHSCSLMFVRRVFACRRGLVGPPLGLASVLWMGELAKVAEARGEERESSTRVWWNGGKSCQQHRETWKQMGNGRYRPPLGIRLEGTEV